MNLYPTERQASEAQRPQQAPHRKTYGVLAIARRHPGLFSLLTRATAH